MRDDDDVDGTARPAAPAPGAESGGLVALFVDRPVFASMLAIAIVAVGVLALTRLPLRLAPEGISANAINMFVPIRQDMPPREVEERVLRPLEELLRTIPGVAEIEARARSGSAFVQISLDTGIDPVLASAEVRDRTQRARLQWPADVDRYFTWREDPSSAPLAFFQVQTPERGADWDHMLDRIVRPRLEAVDGVGRVEMWGLQDETLRIWFDRDKLIEHRIDYGEVLQRLAADNFAAPAGEIDNGHERFLVRVDSKFRSRAEIARYPIRTGLTLGDVARVETVPSVRDSLARFDRRFTYTGILRLASGVNPVEASVAVRAAMDELEQEPDLRGIDFRFLFDQGAMIEDSLSTLLETALQGGALSLIVLWLFLRNLLLTVCVAVAIPLTLMIAAGYLFFTDGSLNILTMAGMTLAVGMVVDNSVVVLENIRRLRLAGAGLREACIAGTREMGLAITMATLTTVVVILPLIFMGTDSNVRVSLAALGLPLSIALLGSLGVALWLLPSATHQVGTGAQATIAARRRGIARWSPVEWLTALNDRALGWTIAGFWRRVAVLGAMALLIAQIRTPMQGLDFDTGSAGPFRGGDVSINLEMPRGKTLEDVYEDVLEYEDFLFARRDEWHVEHVAARFSRTSARFDLMLDATVEREDHARLRRAILDAWPRRPGVQITLRNSGASQQTAGGGAESDARNFVLRLWGPDSEFLTARALEVRDRLARSPLVATVEVGDADGGEQVIVDVDRDRLSDLQVRPEALERTVGSGLRGMELTRFEEADREIRLIAQFDADRDPTLHDLRETRVFSSAGAFQRLDDLAEIRFERSLETIERRDGKTHVSIVGERTAAATSQEISALLQTVMESTPLPRGYSFSEDSASQEIQSQLAEIFDASLLSVVLVFLLMGILFESVIVPAAILVTVLFAVFGAYWSLYLFHGSIDVMAGIGMLLLSGIVVNNGIVLLDCIERFRRSGMQRSEAILAGARVRMRPIAMTSATTIFGLLPMAMFGEATGEGISYVSMSIAVAGGLAVGTLFTPLSVPLVYTFLDGLSEWSRGVRRRALRELRA